MAKEHLKADNLAGVPHGFSDALGLAADDILPGAPLVRLKQVHSNRVFRAGDSWQDPPEGDALVTDRPGLVLCIVTADCAPVLLADQEAGVIGAAHAGWRGALGGVIENTVAEMCALGAVHDRIRAAIGPTIAQASYEVDDALRDRFSPADERFFEPGREGHFQFDLPGFVASRLAAAGVSRVENLAEDTYAQPGRFHSYRRATHLGEDVGGRQLSLIGLAH